MSKRKRGRPPATGRLEIYRIEIMNYEPIYSISVDHPKVINQNPIADHSSLDIIGKLLSPSNVAGKILTVTIYGSRRTQYALHHPEEMTQEIEQVGELEIRGKKAEFWGFATADMMSYLIACLHAQKFRYIDLFSEPLHYGKAKVTSFHFSEKKENGEEEP